MPILLGNSGSPRWYADPDRSFSAYLDMLERVGATSAEIVLHHGPYDERTARVHVIEPDWLETVSAYQARGIAVQLHVSLDQRFATARWRHHREDLKREFEPILALLAAVAEKQDRAAVVLHGSADRRATLDENEDATSGLLDWIATQFESLSLPAVAALELGAAKLGKESAAARSRSSVERIVDRVESDRVGICWDLAHDCENATVETDWNASPTGQFLRRVVHVHLHDLDDTGMAHYPLLLGNVPIVSQLTALTNARSIPSLTMEVRWLCATRLGEPWEMLERSYEAVWRVIHDVVGSD